MQHESSVGCILTDFPQPLKQLLMKKRVLSLSILFFSALCECSYIYSADKLVMASFMSLSGCKMI